MTPWDDGVTWYTDLVTPGSGDIVALSFLRDQHLRALTDSEEDPEIARALEAATVHAEHYTKRAIRDQTWDLTMDRFPWTQCIVLPYPPLVSVTSITYLDSAGASQTLATSEYDVFRVRGPKASRSVIRAAYDVAWPETRAQSNAVVVRFRAGYVDTDVSPEVENIPDDIRVAVSMRAAELYKQRSDSVIGVGATVTPALLSSRALMADYRVF